MILSHARPGLAAYDLFDQTLTVWADFFSMQNSCFRKNIYWKFLPRQTVPFFRVSLQENTLFLPLLNLTRILLKNSSFLPHCFGICREGFCSRDTPFSILLLTLSSSPLRLGQIASLLKKSNLFRRARAWQRMLQRLDRIVPINITAEMFLHVEAESREAQSSPFCCPGKDGAQRRAGEVVWEETAAFTQRNPPLLPL